MTPRPLATIVAQDDIAPLDAPMVRRRVPGTITGSRRAPLAMHQNSSQVSNMLNPVMSDREAARRAGKKPVNHARHNLLAIKEMSEKNAQRKRAEMAAMEAKAKGFRAAPAPPRRRPSTSASFLDDYDVDFVAANKRETVRRAAAEGREKLIREERAAEEARRASPLLKRNYGRVPAYLRERKLEMAAARRDAEAAERAAHIPPGMRVLPEEERLETLEILRVNRADVEEKLRALPIAKTDSQTLRRRKSELEARLAEIEDAQKVFERKTVLVRE